MAAAAPILPLLALGLMGGGGGGSSAPQMQAAPAPAPPPPPEPEEIIAPEAQVSREELRAQALRRARAREQSTLLNLEAPSSQNLSQSLLSGL